MYKQKNDFLDPYQQSKCPVCGGEEFEWGRLGGQTYYVPGESMWRLRGWQYIRTRIHDDPHGERIGIWLDERDCAILETQHIFTDPHQRLYQELVIGLAGKNLYSFVEHALINDIHLQGCILTHGQLLIKTHEPQLP